MTALAWGPFTFLFGQSNEISNNIPFTAIRTQENEELQEEECKGYKKCIESLAEDKVDLDTLSENFEKSWFKRIFIKEESIREINEEIKAVRYFFENIQDVLNERPLRGKKHSLMDIKLELKKRVDYLEEKVLPNYEFIYKTLDVLNIIVLAAWTYISSENKFGEGKQVYNLAPLIISISKETVSSFLLLKEKIYASRSEDKNKIIQIYKSIIQNLDSLIDEIVEKEKEQEIGRTRRQGESRAHQADDGIYPKPEGSRLVRKNGFRINLPA